MHIRMFLGRLFYVFACFDLETEIEIMSENIKVGAWVKLIDSDATGQVLEVNRNNLVLAIGDLRSVGTLSPHVRDWMLPHRFVLVEQDVRRDVAAAVYIVKIGQESVKIGQFWFIKVKYIYYNLPRPTIYEKNSKRNNYHQL